MQRRTFVQALTMQSLLATSAYGGPPPGPDYAQRPSVPAPGAYASHRQFSQNWPASQTSVSMNMVVMRVCGAPEAKPFQAKFFGMPIVVGPYREGDRLRIIYEGSLLSFEPAGSGFEAIETRPLPAPPGNESGAEKASIDGNAGYQLGANGEVYWVGPETVFQFSGKKWIEKWIIPSHFPKERNIPGISLRGGIILLPNGLVADIGGLNGFIQILELPADPSIKAREIKVISYDELGCNYDSYPRPAPPSFCVVGENLFFYLNDTGHLFRLNLNDYKLTELKVPWTYRLFSDKLLPSVWENCLNSDYTFPIFPGSITFIPGREGSVWVGGLMLNLTSPTLYAFEIDSEGSSSRPTILTNGDFPKEPCFRNKQGDLVGISSSIGQKKIVATRNQ